MYLLVNQMKYKLDRSAHFVYSLRYHLVIVIKYRRKALYDEAIRERLKQIIWSLTDEFTATPTTNLSNIVNVIKGVNGSWRRIWMLVGGSTIGFSKT
jgi:putative transposase